jgi:hypothetical protein
MLQIAIYSCSASFMALTSNYGATTGEELAQQLLAAPLLRLQPAGTPRTMTPAVALQVN